MKKLFPFFPIIFLLSVQASEANQRIQNENIFSRQERKILHLTKSLQKKIRRSARFQSDMNLKMSFIENQMDLLQKDIEQLVSNAKQNRRAFMQGYYLNRSVKSMNPAERMMMAKNPAELDRQVFLIHRLSVSARDEVENNLKRLASLNSKKKDFEKQSEREKILLTKQAEIEKKLENDLQLLEKVLDKIKRNKKFARKSQKEIQDLLLKNGETSTLLDGLYETKMARMKGQINPPISGEVHARSGYKPASQEFVHFPSQGVFIQASDDSEVKSILAGKVVLREFIAGLGETLVLDHGDEFQSIYSGLKTIAVSEGEVVKQNQFIGMPSESIYHSKKGIYFEIRQYGEPLAAVKWMKSPQRKTTE